MANPRGLLYFAHKIRYFCTHIRPFSAGKVIFNKPNSTILHIDESQVKGLSDRVVTNNVAAPVGPGAAKTTNYKNPEYFLYNQASYFEAEVEMLKYRCPQPSSKTKSTN